MSDRRYIAEPQAPPKQRADEQAIDLSPAVHDQVSTTTCYMCACRCGIKVHLQDGRIRYIEGNRDHPVNKGVLCAKGSAGIMTHYSPARLRKPLKRVGERGAGEFQEIEWDEALKLATEWLGNIRATDPKKLAFFTGRDQSQALTGWWAAQFGTPNYAAHGGFCSVNMAAAGLYTIGGSFWEFGEPDWERTRYFLMFGVAEDHGSNPIKIGLGQLKNRPADNRAKFVSINPVRTGYSAIADEWIGITPGTDGLFVLAIVHELLKADRIDLDFLVRYTNAPWLVIDAPGTAGHGLFARDDAGNPLCVDTRGAASTTRWMPDMAPRLVGEVTLPRRARGAAGVRADGGALSRRELRAGEGGGAMRYSRRDHPAHRGGAGRGGIRSCDRNSGRLDRLGRAAPRQDHRPPGLHACDARSQRAFQRLPDLPRHPSAADAAGLDRLPRRLPLQAAVPEIRAAARQARRAGRADACAARIAARFPDRARGSADRSRTASRIASTRRSAGRRRSPSMA